MPKSTEHLLIDNLLTIYQHQAVIVEHPKFEAVYSAQKPAMLNRIPFHCVEKGGCTVTCNGKDYALEQGDFIAIMSGSDHRLHINDDQVLDETTLVCGYFEFSNNHNMLLLDSFPEVLVAKNADTEKSEKIKTLVQLMIQELSTDKPGAEKASAMLADLLFIEILRSAIKNLRADKGLIAALADRHLSRALNAFHRNVDQPWTLDSLAREAGISRTKFATHFKQIVGISPGNYITQWRIYWAAAKLKNTKESPYQIAIEAGYHSSASFSRAFSKLMQTSPINYRKSHHS